MKKLITLDELAICFCGATGYGLGYLIPDNFGAPEIISILICLLAGIAMEGLADWIVFSKQIQERHSRRILAWGICIMVFIAGSIFAFRIAGSNLNEELKEEFAWTLGIPIVSFVISFVVYTIKKKILRQKYGDGSKGYLLLDENKAYVASLNGQNKPVTGDYDDSLAVKTQTGIYIGKDEGKVIAWLGIPYALPPIGNLRWKKPVPLEPSDEIYEAQYYGASALQPDNPAQPLNYHRQSEDCLYLNVWKAKDSKQNIKYSVLVYLHDGYFISGGSADPIVEGRSFVKKNPETIFVSFNYRLGLFGFVDFSEVPGGLQYPDSVNCGLYDQIEALRWLHQNISCFGGDPENVTLIGAGSGATSALLLSTLEASKGLFRKIISVSASLEYVYNDKTASTKGGTSLATQFGASNMTKLIRIPAKKIKKKMMAHSNLGCTPSCNTDSLPDNFFKTMINNQLRPDLEIIFVLPKNEFSNAVALWGKSVTVKALTDVYDRIKSDQSETEWHSVLDAFQIERPDAKSDEDEFIRKISTLTHIDIPLFCGKLLSDNGHAIHCLLWDIIPDIDRFKSNATSFLSTVFQNFEAGETFGYICGKDLAELIQLLFVKFLNDEDLKLYHNEIIGMDALNWPEYKRDNPVVMRVDQNEIQFDSHFHEKEMQVMERISHYGT